MARLDKHEPIPVRKAEPIGKCKVCGEPTYDPEESDFCLWCSGHGEENFFEELLDNSGDSGIVELQAKNPMASVSKHLESE
jgi:hypothetical protein